MKTLLKSVLPDAVVGAVSRQRYQRRRIRKYQRLRTEAKDGYTLEGYDRLQCIYIHIPKNAGVSVTRGLFGSLGGGHLTARDYRQIFGRQAFNQYFKFTIARNPWDRVFSAWRFLRAGGMGEDDREWAQRHLSDYDSFRDFILRGLGREEIQSALHFRPQHEFVCESGSTTPMVDYVGYLETLESDFQAICERLGVKATLPRLNASGNNSYRDAYDAETRAIVATRYRRDIELFGYTFEGVAHRLSPGSVGILPAKDVGNTS